LRNRTILAVNYLLMIVLISLVLQYNLTSARADPVPVLDYDNELGGLMPATNVTLGMPLSNVTIDVNASNTSAFLLNVDGEYTILNSGNTSNITIAAPFSSLISIDNSSVSITANGSNIPWAVVSNAPVNWNWSIYEFGSMQFFISNLSMPANSSCLLRYQFNGLMSYVVGNTVFRTEVTEIIYDIGTSRSWYGNTSETVTMNVVGIQPTSCYTGYPGTPPIISNITGGKSYTWAWNDQKISTDMLALMYGVPEVPGMPIQGCVAGLVVGVVAILVTVVQKRKRQAESPPSDLNTNP